MEEIKETWSSLPIKEKIQYLSAVGLLASGVILAFICAIFNFWEITSGVLIYVAQAFITAGGIYGVSIYFKTQLGEFESRRNKIIEEYIDKVSKRIEDEIEVRKKLE